MTIAAYYQAQLASLRQIESALDSLAEQRLHMIGHLDTLRHLIDHGQGDVLWPETSREPECGSPREAMTA